VKGLRRWGLGLLAILLVLGGLWLARARLLPAIAHWLDVGEPLQRTEYVMVLPGGLETRPFVAAALVKAGVARQVLVPETEVCHSEKEKPFLSAHEIIHRVLAHRGVPEEDIRILQGQSNSTFGDIEALGRFLESSPGVRVAVVTDGYHTRRARWTVARLLGEQARQISLVSAPTDEFCVDAWWQTDVGCMRIVGEYPKLAYYAFRYGSLAYWMAGVAGLVVTVLIYGRVRRSRMPVQPTFRTSRSRYLVNFRGQLA